MSPTTTFKSPEEERTYLTSVKSELDNAQTKADVIDVWKRHYLTIGHRKLAACCLAAHSTKS